MSTDYTAAITAVVILVIGLTGMVTYVLSRPSDLAPRS
jgi:preprotein translocase subunit Sss1